MILKNILKILNINQFFHNINKLDLINRDINNSDMDFIFQYGFKNLEYLNLENNNITSEGIKHLRNKSLINIKYLNLSNNPINDQGLTFLNYLSNLNELILLNMNELSDDYFFYLETNNFINKINILECDKNKLTLKNIYSNYNNFFLPNLNHLKIISSCSDDNLEKLVTLDNICSKIIYLNLSNSGLTDRGLNILTENINKFKKIEEINVLYNKFNYINEKYFIELMKNKIKIKFSEKLLRNFNILLGGSAFAGKTTYFKSYFAKKFEDAYINTIGFDKKIFDLLQVKFTLWDGARWGGYCDSIIKGFMEKIFLDGIILLFDLSEKKDFDDLPNLLKMIPECYNLKDFPILLIGNKSDLHPAVNQDEIDIFVKENKLIGYFNVSCKNYINVEESVNFIINYIMEKEYKKFNEKKLNK